ncbi:unnamed protein product [Tetraodon nigroviridis]|nr:unnamed protein product [Tetraodon nigroviridis]
MGGNFGPFSEPRTVIFKKILTNNENGYNQQTGIFTAPEPGFYCFSFSYHARQTQPSGLNLMKNNEVILKSFSERKMEGSFVDNASSTACLQLNSGDTVYVSLPASYHVQGTGDCTSFSGFLVK